MNSASAGLYHFSAAYLFIEAHGRDKIAVSFHMMQAASFAYGANTEDALWLKPYSSIYRQMHHATYIRTFFMRRNISCRDIRDFHL